MFDPTGPSISRTPRCPREGRPDRLGDAGAHVRPLERRPEDDLNLRSRVRARRGRLDERRLESARPDHRVGRPPRVRAGPGLPRVARGPRSATSADAVYTSVTGIARRFGFGPRPTQTRSSTRPPSATCCRTSGRSPDRGDGEGRGRVRATELGEDRIRSSGVVPAAARRPAPARVPARRSQADEGRLRLYSAPLRDRLALLLGGLVEERRQVLSQVHRLDDGRPPDLDDGDPAEPARPHPEALERQVEQGEQGDLEHVVGRRRSTTVGRRRPVVAATCGAISVPGGRRQPARRGRPPARR